MTEPNVIPGTSTPPPTSPAGMKATTGAVLTEVAADAAATPVVATRISGAITAVSFDPLGGSPPNNGLPGASQHVQQG